MAAKQKPLTVGKGTSYTRPVTPGKSPRPVSAKPSAASKARAAQRTTSSGITKRPDGKRQAEGRTARTRVSTATVTSSEARKPSPRGAGLNQGKGAGRGRVTGTQGRPTPANPPKVTQGQGQSARAVEAKQWQRLNQSTSARAGKAAEAKPRTPAPGTGNVVRTAIERGRAAAAQKGARAATQAMSRTLAAARTARNIAGAAKMAGPAGVAAAVLAPRRLGDATMKGKPTGNPQGPAVPKRLTKAGIDKGSFDKAFKAARSGGAKTFTWRGKKYNTKLRGE